MRRALTIAVATVGTALVLPGSALAGQDQLGGGSVALQLQSSKALKLKPSSLNLPITGGSVDPIDGSGPIYVNGAFKAKTKKAKKKVKVILTTITLGGNGAPGTISAKVNGDLVGVFGATTGGRVTRSGLGATITGVSAQLASRGARALNRAFSGKKGKKGKKSARSAKKKGGVKAGLPLGSFTANTIPSEVEVVPGSGTLTLTIRDAVNSPFVSQKLPAHCVDPLPTGSPAGVSPISPATTTMTLLPTIDVIYNFPVAGGSASPNFTAGNLLTAGGQQITKNTSSLPPPLPGSLPPACSSAAPPVGTSILSKDFGVDFANSSLTAVATTPDGTLPRAPLAGFDFASANRTFDPATNTISFSGAVARLTGLAPGQLNTALPNQSGNPANDFAEGDVLGSFSLTAKLR